MTFTATLLAFAATGHTVGQGNTHAHSARGEDVRKPSFSHDTRMCRM